jgi:hypothetical protein
MQGQLQPAPPAFTSHGVAFVMEGVRLLALQVVAHLSKEGLVTAAERADYGSAAVAITPLRLHTLVRS